MAAQTSTAAVDAACPLDDKDVSRSDTGLTLIDACSTPKELTEFSTRNTLLGSPSLFSSSTCTLNKSVFHIYHRKLAKRHLVISPVLDPERERCFHTPGFLRRDKEIDEVPGLLEKLQEEAARSQGYFIHKPSLSFHHPPRSLRRGSHKHAPVACLIHNSTFWRRWRLQFGDHLEETMDPRGVVARDHYSAAHGKDDRALKGYRVRSWRLWDESGREYHREVNEERRKSKLDSRDPGSEPKMSSETSSETSSDTDSEVDMEKFEPRTADEVVYLDWTSPFSSNTRRYHFHYHLDFYWKGTGTVKENRKGGFLLHFHHLKLVVRVPLDTDREDAVSPESSVKRIVSKKGKGDFAEVCLATYTSSLASRKAGQLELCDAAIWRVWYEHISPRRRAEQSQVDKEMLAEVENENENENEKQKAEDDVDISAVKKTRLYDLIVATAVCMLVGEWQKREVVKRIIEAAATEGGGSAG